MLSIPPRKLQNSENYHGIGSISIGSISISMVLVFMSTFKTNNIKNMHMGDTALNLLTFADRSTNTHET